MAKPQKKSAAKGKSSTASLYTITTTTLLVVLAAASVFMYVSMRHMDSKLNTLTDDDAQSSYDAASDRSDSIF
jgi:hypothetical protein